MDNSKIKDFFDKKSLTWEQRPARPIEQYDDFAKRNFHIKKGDKVLDLGCGTGSFDLSIYKLNQAEILGLDISPLMIDIAKKKFEGHKDITFMSGDFYNLDLKGFDVIVMHNAYSHFLDPKALSKKCSEALNDNGILVMSHFQDIDFINTRHSNINPLIGRQIKSTKEEAINFLDEFDIVSLSDAPEYIITLRKKKDA